MNKFLVFLKNAFTKNIPLKILAIVLAVFSVIIINI